MVGFKTEEKDLHGDITHPQAIDELDDSELAVLRQPSLPKSLKFPLRMALPLLYPRRRASRKKSPPLWRLSPSRLQETLLCSAELLARPRYRAERLRRPTLLVGRSSTPPPSWGWALARSEPPRRRTDANPCPRTTDCRPFE